MKRVVENTHIEKQIQVISPGELKKQFPVTEKAARTVSQSRSEIVDIITGKDKRLLAIIGPCSIHDVEAAKDFAARLRLCKNKYSEKLCIIMRVYFEKPRTTLGWRGLIVDPDLNQSYNITDGLKIARRLLIDINEAGLPAASEILDPIIPQYIADLVSWAAIGARTTESQIHRELSSGLSMPVGFKNGTDGDITNAVNALKSSRHPHSFLGIDQSGRTCILTSTGNPYNHIILRGGKNGPNYHVEKIEEVEKMLKHAGEKPAVVVDCSHANSGKKQERQDGVLKSIVDSRAAGHEAIVGFMAESNIFPGNQEITNGRENLKYGVSVTDECVGWDQTEKMLEYAFKHHQL